MTDIRKLRMLDLCRQLKEVIQAESHHLDPMDWLHVNAAISVCVSEHHLAEAERFERRNLSPAVLDVADVREE